MINVPMIKDYKRTSDKFIVIPKSKKIDDSNKFLISVITVTKNSQNTIEQTILSVINQACDNVEYIIVDGESTDNTLNIIEKYKSSISMCISEPDKGISDAFNKGVSMSNGDIIAIINSDDWYEEGAFAKILEILDNHDVGVIHGKLKRWFQDDEYEISESDDRNLALDSTINHPTVFAKRSIYEQIGLFSLDFKVAMDYEWLLRAKNKANANFFYIDSCLANMRISGVSSQRWVRANKEVLIAKNLYKWSINNYCYYYYKLLKSFISLQMSTHGLNRVVKFYRRNFALVKKETL